MQVGRVACGSSRSAAGNMAMRENLGRQAALQGRAHLLHLLGLHQCGGDLVLLLPAHTAEPDRVIGSGARRCRSLGVPSARQNPQRAPQPFRQDGLQVRRNAGWLTSPSATPLHSFSCCADSRALRQKMKGGEAASVGDSCPRSKAASWQGWAPAQAFARRLLQPPAACAPQAARRPPRKCTRPATTAVAAPGRSAAAPPGAARRHHPAAPSAH